MRLPLSYIPVIFIILGLCSCNRQADVDNSWKAKIVFENYLLPEVDSISKLLKNEYFGFELFNNFKNNDSIQFFNQIINLKEQSFVYTAYSEEKRAAYDRKLKKNRSRCFKKLRNNAIQRSKLDWQNANVEQVEYVLFDVEDSKLFIKVIVKVKHNGSTYELLAPDCVYTINGLKLVQPVHWEGISCWMML